MKYFQLKDSERKLKELETCDCFKSCNVNGSVQPDGSTWKQDCNICYCHVSKKCSAVETVFSN